jgi:hypothetical protein
MSNFVLLEGFDLFSATMTPSVMYTTSGTVATSSTTVNSRGQSINVSSGGFILLPYKTGGATTATSTTSFWVNRANASATEIIGFYTPSTSAVMSLYDQSDGTMKLLGGAVGAISPNAGAYTQGAWNHIEIVYTQNSSSGSISLYINGVFQMTVSGVNTGSNPYDRIALFGGGSGGTYFDHVSMTDDVTGPLGTTYVETLEPSANSSVAWTPLAGNNYANVNEGGTDGDTSYVSAAVATTKDEYLNADLPDNPLSVFAVEAQYVGRKDDATARTVRSNIKSSSTTSNGTTNTMTTSYALYHGGVLTLDPATSAAWTPAGVNAAKQQLEVVS